VWQVLVKEAASRFEIQKSKMSAGGEKFCLKWNEFESNVSTAFRELREDKDFFDVTLACDDEQIEAHKVILSACSPFFRKVLRKNPHAHPLLYLKGVKFTDLQSVLNFMYHGEVNVAQEELNSFLAVAEELQVKGLTQNGGTPSSTPLPKRPPEQPRPQKQQIRPSPVPPRPPYEPPPAQQSGQMEVAEVVGSNIKTEPQQQVVDLGGEDESGVVEYGEEEEYQYGGQDYHYQEDLHQGMGEAGAAGGWNPPTFKGFPCQYCEKSFSSKKSLQNHTTSHMGLTLCVPCNRHFSTASNLKAHVNLMHPEMMPPISEGKQFLK